MAGAKFIGLDDIDHAAVVTRGGDRYGDHQLFKCPRCGHPMLLDFEHDYFYPEIQRLERRFSFEQAACQKCSVAFAAEDLWELGRACLFHPEWLLTSADAELPGVRELIRSAANE